MTQTGKIVVLAMVSIMLGAFACDSTHQIDKPQQAEEAPKPHAKQIFASAAVNVITLCDGRNLVYVANNSQGVAIQVLPEGCR